MKMLIITLMALAFTNSSLYSVDLDSLNIFTGWESNGYEFTQKLTIGKIDFMEILPGGKYLFTADSNKYFRIWDLSSGKITWMQEVAYNLPICLQKDSLVYFRNGKDTITDLNIYHMKDNRIIKNVKKFFIVNDWSIHFYSPNEMKVLNDSILYCSTIHYEYISSGHRYQGGANSFSLDDFRLIQDRIGYYYWSDHCFSDIPGIYMADLYQHWDDTRPGGTIFGNSHIFQNNQLNVRIGYDYIDFRQKRYKCFNLAGDIGIISVADRMVVYDFTKKYFLFNGKINTTFKEIAVNQDDFFIGLNNKGNQIVAMNYPFIQFESFPMSDTISFHKLRMDNYSNRAILGSEMGIIRMVSLDSMFTNPKSIDFHSDKQEIIQQQEVAFSPEVPISVKEIIWDFGDGEESSLPYPKHIYKQVGIFAVSLRAILPDDTLFLIKDKYITVKPVYYPEIIQDKLSGVSPLNISFQLKSEFSYDSLSWDFGDGQQLNGSENPSHVFSEPGKYKISMTVFKDGSGFTDYSTVFAYDKPIVKDSLLINIVNKGNWSGGGTSSSETKYSFRDFSQLRNGKYQYLFVTKRIDAYGSSSDESQEFIACYSNPDFLTLKTYKTSKDISIMGYCHDGMVIKQPTNICEFYNRYGDLLFSKADNGFFKSHQLSDSTFIRFDKYNVLIYNQYFDSLQYFYMGNIIPDFSDKGALLGVVNHHILDKFFILYQYPNEKTLWFGRFSADGELEASSEINDFVLYRPILKSNKEIILFDKDSTLLSIDLDGSVLDKQINPVFPDVAVYDQNYYFNSKVDADSIITRFYNLSGTLVRVFNTPIHSTADMYEKSYPYCNKNSDNSATMVWNEFELRSNARIAVIIFPNVIDTGVDNEEETFYSYPNPAEDYLSIPIPAGSFRSAEVYDIYGKQTTIESELISSSGSDIIRLYIDQLSIGCWFYFINCTEGPISGKFQKIK